MSPRAYRVEIVALVEADSAAEAQQTTGLLLAGVNILPNDNGAGTLPLNGPGSWAPTMKRITEVVADCSQCGDVRTPGEAKTWPELCAACASR